MYRGFPTQRSQGLESQIAAFPLSLGMVDRTARFLQNVLAKVILLSFIPLDLRKNVHGIRNGGSFW